MPRAGTRDGNHLVPGPPLSARHLTRKRLRFRPLPSSLPRGLGMAVGAAVSEREACGWLVVFAASPHMTRYMSLRASTRELPPWSLRMPASPRFPRPGSRCTRTPREWVLAAECGAGADENWADGAQVEIIRAGRPKWFIEAANLVHHVMSRDIVHSSALRTRVVDDALSPNAHRITAVADRGAEVAGYLATYLLPFVTVPQPSAKAARTSAAATATGYVICRLRRFRISGKWPGRR